MTTIEKACEITGFKKCGVGTDPDPCDKCGEQWKHLYSYMIDPYSNDADFFCSSCVIDQVDEDKGNG